MHRPAVRRPSLCAVVRASRWSSNVLASEVCYCRPHTLTSFRRATSLARAKFAKWARLLAPSPLGACESVVVAEPLPTTLPLAAPLASPWSRTNSALSRTPGLLAAYQNSEIRRLTGWRSTVTSRTVDDAACRGCSKSAASDVGDRGGAAWAMFVSAADDNEAAAEAIASWRAALNALPAKQLNSTWWKLMFEHGQWLCRTRRLRRHVSTPPHSSDGASSTSRRA